MSDDEEVMHSEEEEETAEQSDEEESREATPEKDDEAPPADSGPSEAELAMQRRRQQQSTNYGNLDEEAQELLEANKEERGVMEQEIQELRERRERRKKEREEEERNMAARRSEEEARRKQEEEERQAKKFAEEAAKREARAAKMAEFEKWKNVSSSPNFVIQKKEVTNEGGGEGDEEDEAQAEKKSKEQLEAEKRAILEQRTPTLAISGFDSHKLTDKAKELHALIMRLESEKYDLEKRFKAQQYDMMELAERARQMNKVGKGETLKRVQLGDETDVMSERFAGCPSKIVMFSQFERQMDKRPFDARSGLFTGPNYKYQSDRIQPTRILKWSEDGLPLYEEEQGQEGEAPAE